ncbi:MAG: phosphoglycerate kinase [Clostridia bacterium]|nr:phosphoglycerate kinase [Clostridia bacterium]
MLNKKTVRDIEVNSKKVLLRCDLNVPLDKDTKSIILSDKRIVESLKTINYLLSAGAKVIICSHMSNRTTSLKPVSIRLSELLNKNVEFCGDILSDEVSEKIKMMQNGDVILLENLRMHAEEEANDIEFAKKIASLADVYVNDAFGTTHRAHASIVGVTEFLPAVSGFLIEKEIDALDHSINNPKRPIIAIIGGAKVSTKIGVITTLMDKVDAILIGGAMAYTFIKSKGGKIGKSLCEDDKLDIASEILKKAEEKNIKLLLPVDNIITTDLSGSSDTQVCDSNNIPEDYSGVDIGPKTIEIYKKEIGNAATVVWNGPLGIFEIERFSNGTKEIANTIANSNIISIIGGGDVVAAVEELGLDSKMTHVSTGGGASLEFMEGKELPGIKSLQDK